MGIVQNIVKRIPSVKDLSGMGKSSTTSNEKIIHDERQLPGLAFFRRRIRLRGNSKISIPLGIVLLFPTLVIIMIAVLFIRHSGNQGNLLLPAGAPPAIRRINEKHDKVFVTGCTDPEDQARRHPRANAAFVVLARDKELDGVIQSVKSIERHFNRWFHYPYVFLNDGDFSDNFINTIRNYTSGSTKFGKIDKSMWGYPDWVDHEVAQEGIRKQGDAAIMYGGMESYHHMCRFYSGFFYKHELLQEYDWYWRLEPEIKYFCDITYDPFLKMIEQNKTYAFTIAVKELRETVPNIFRYASAYKRKNNLKSQGLWEMFIDPPMEIATSLPTDDPRYKEPFDPSKLKPGVLPPVDAEAMDGENYNMCHFWSNFEIARLSWFRSKEYEDFFQMMDRSGGFWMERWGDAPIHSLAAGALLKVSDVHYFRDFGYRHTTIQHCPANAPARQDPPRIPYLERTTKDRKAREEEDEYWEDWDQPQENGVGCHCRCDRDIVDVEGKSGSCLAEWVDVAGGWIS